MPRTSHDFKQSTLMQPPLIQTKFKGYQNHHVASSVTRLSSNRGASLAKIFLFILGPSLIVGAGLFFQSYQRQNLPFVSQPVITGSQGSENQSSSGSQSKEITQQTMSTVSSVTTSFSVRTAPMNNSLKVLPRKDTYAPVETAQENTLEDLNTMSSSTGHTIRVAGSSESQLDLLPTKPLVSVKSSTPESSNDLLEGLDLTELSPDLALKLESMMVEQQGSSEPMDSRPVGNLDSKVIGLETHSNRLSGVLPKLDLQTHMYSSSETKRWVKVNGHEVAQGEWIERGIQLLEIKPQSVIIEFNQQKIEIPALYEWKG